MTPAVSLLLKAPVVGSVKTRLAATVGARRATEIYRQLVERQMRALPRGWPVFVHFDPPSAEAAMRAWLQPLRSESDGPIEFAPQPPGDLGVRIHAALLHAFATGAPAAIVIGGDCPALGPTLLVNAAATLSDHDAVLGPADDGGYYLLGLKAPCADLFASVAWSTPAVLDQTRARLRAARRRTAELPVLADVDDEAGWRRAVAAGLLPPRAGE